MIQTRSTKKYFPRIPKGTKAEPKERATWLFPNLKVTSGAPLPNAMNVAPEAEDDFNAWYDEEHLPALIAVPGTLSARRYRSAVEGADVRRYVAIYHLETPDVTRSDAWKTAVDTPWSARVRLHFQDHLRILTKRYVREG